MKGLTSLLFTGALILGASAQSKAGIIWDYSPATTGADEQLGWVNVTNFQAFAESVSFSSSLQIWGMDIYCPTDVGIVVGELVTIRLWSDNAGTPDTLLASFSESISIIDTDGSVNPRDTRVHADFTVPLSLSASTTYWIGMSSLNPNFSQTSLTGALAPEDSRMAQFNGTDTFSFMAQVGDMAFRLHDARLTAVPEPTGLALIIPVAIVGLAAARRRHKAIAR